jgi:hypothetical protein
MPAGRYTYWNKAARAAEANETLCKDSAGLGTLATGRETARLERARPVWSVTISRANRRREGGTRELGSGEEVDGSGRAGPERFVPERPRVAGSRQRRWWSSCATGGPRSDVDGVLTRSSRTKRLSLVQTCSGRGWKRIAVEVDCWRRGRDRPAVGGEPAGWVADEEADIAREPGQRRATWKDEKPREPATQSR